METQIELNSKLGKLYLSATAKGVSALSWERNQSLEVSRSINEHQALAAKELEAYALGKLSTFTCKIDYESMRATSFQIKVWKKLREITLGEVKSYQEVALSLGDKNLVRAIGGANGKNRVLIIIPCHRVISKDGSLGGFSAGLERKRKLLKLEGIEFSG